MLCRHVSFHPLVAASLALGLTACAGAPTPMAEDGSEDRCGDATREATLRWARLAEVAQPLATAPSRDTMESRARTALHAHVVSLRESPRELDGETAMALSNTMMDGIDALGADLPNAERNRADDAAEALLTDRSRDGSRRAAEGALLAFEAALDAARPAERDARALRQAASQIGPLAERAAEAYTAGVAEGDRAAERAEGAELPEGSELAAARERAEDASRRARSDCEHPRTLRVPGA